MGREHGAVPAGAEPLTKSVPTQHLTIGGSEQVRVVAEDLLLELAQRRRRVDTELLDQHRTVLLVPAERIGLPAGPVERGHQLRRNALAKRVLSGDRLEVRDDLARPAARELGFEQQLLGHQPQLRKRWASARAKCSSSNSA